MSIFDRIGLLLRSNVNAMVDKAEDPQKILDQLLIDMRDQFIQAKQQVAVAIAARTLGVQATIVMPEDAPKSKLEVIPIHYANAADVEKILEDVYGVAPSSGSSSRASTAALTITLTNATYTRTVSVTRAGQVTRS